MNVPRETDRLSAYADLLIEWNRRIKLVGPALTRDALDDEIRDCLRLQDHLTAPTVVDLGSGSGLPAVPLALVDPERHWTLIEADGRKAAFLNAVRRTLHVANMEVVDQRIEDVSLPPANEMTARAFAPLDRLIELAAPHLALSGRLLLLKGARVHEEIERASERWSFDHEIVEDAAHRGCVLIVTNIRTAT